MSGFTTGLCLPVRFFTFRICICNAEFRFAKPAITDERLVDLHQFGVYTDCFGIGPGCFRTIADTVGAILIGGAPLAPTAAVGENEWISLILNTGAGFNSDDALWLRIESTGYTAWVDNVMVTIQ